MPSLELVSPDFLDTAPFRVVTEVVVEAPIDACWSLLADQESWPKWFDGLTLDEATPGIWTQPGDTRKVTVNRLKVEETAISVEPEREYAFSITRWPLPTAKRGAEGVRLQDRTSDGVVRTHLTYIGAFESTAIGRLAEWVLKRQLSAAWGGALVALGDLAAKQAANGGNAG